MVTFSGAANLRLQHSTGNSTAWGPCKEQPRPTDQDCEFCWLISKNENLYFPQDRRRCRLSTRLTSQQERTGRNQSFWCPSRPGSRIRPLDSEGGVLLRKWLKLLERMSQRKCGTASWMTLPWQRLRRESTLSCHTVRTGDPANWSK